MIIATAKNELTPSLLFTVVKHSLRLDVSLEPEILTLLERFRDSFISFFHFFLRSTLSTLGKGDGPGQGKEENLVVASNK